MKFSWETNNRIQSFNNLSFVAKKWLVHQLGTELATLDIDADHYSKLFDLQDEYVEVFYDKETNSIQAVLAIYPMASVIEQYIQDIELPN